MTKSSKSINQQITPLKKIKSGHFQKSGRENIKRETSKTRCYRDVKTATTYKITKTAKWDEVTKIVTIKTTTTPVVIKETTVTTLKHRGAPGSNGKVISEEPENFLRKNTGNRR